MTAPTITASLDKTSYAPGEPMTLTVVYGDPDTKTTTTTITGTDQSGAAATVTVAVRVVDRVAVTVTDDGGRVWTKQSDSGAIQVYTAKA